MSSFVKTIPYRIRDTTTEACTQVLAVVTIDCDGAMSAPVSWINGTTVTASAPVVPAGSVMEQGECCCNAVPEPASGVATTVTNGVVDVRYSTGLAVDGSNNLVVAPSTLSGESGSATFTPGDSIAFVGACGLTTTVAESGSAITVTTALDTLSAPFQVGAGMASPSPITANAQSAGIAAAQINVTNPSNCRPATLFATFDDVWSLETTTGTNIGAKHAWYVDVAPYDIRTDSIYLPAGNSTSYNLSGVLVMTLAPGQTVALVNHALGESVAGSTGVVTAAASIRGLVVVQ